MVLNDLYSEYERIKNMPLDEFQQEYGIDDKEEMLEEIQDEIDYYERGDDNEDVDEYCGCNTYHLDVGFSSWEQVNAMFV